MARPLLLLVFALSFLFAFSYTTTALGKTSIVTPRKIYQFYCAQCHGTSGRGDGVNATKTQPVKPRNHTSSSEMGELTDDDLLIAIRRGGRASGKSTMMPPFEGTLTEAEILGLKEYLRELCSCVGK